MQAQPLTTGPSAIAVADNTFSPPVASLPEIGSITPSVSQPYDRWTDLPDDLAVQLMYWLMRESGSAPLALTSKRFLQAGQAFHAGPWYEGVKSLQQHARCVDWTRSYLSGFANERRLIFLRNADDLDAGLAHLGKAPEDHRRSIVIDGRPIAAAQGTDWLDGFRRYQGKSLVLTTGKRTQAETAIIQIAEALPQRVCLRLEFYLGMSLGPAPVEGMARLIGRIVLSGRPTAFDMEWGVDLCADPAELGAVLDIACGEGTISFLNLGAVNDPDILLRALSDRCDRLRHLKLVMFECTMVPDRSELAALAAALEQRQAAGHARLTVVIASMAMEGNDPSGKPVFSVGERAGFERCGLYFEFLDGELPGHPAVRKVIRSVGQGAADAWVPRVPHVPRVQNVPCVPLAADEPSSDSDVLVESSEEGEAPASPASELVPQPAERRITPPARTARQDAEGAGPRLRKRDRCVIS